VNLLSLSLCNPRRLILAWLRCMGALARESRVSVAIYLLDVVGRPGLHQSGLTSFCFVGCFSPGPRKNDLTIYWALGPFVRSFTSLVDPGDIYPPQPRWRILSIVDCFYNNIDNSCVQIYGTKAGLIMLLSRVCENLIRNLKTGKVDQTLSLSGGKTTCIACHPTLPILVTVLDDGIVCFWDASIYR
jgi:hypothetical protein